MLVGRGAQRTVVLRVLDGWQRWACRVRGGWWVRGRAAMGGRLRRCLSRLLLVLVLVLMLVLGWLLGWMVILWRIRRLSLIHI